MINGRIRYRLELMTSGCCDDAGLTARSCGAGVMLALWRFMPTRGEVVDALQAVDEERRVLRLVDWQIDLEKA